MRIALVNYEYPPLGGGGGYGSQMLAEKMVRAGCEVHVLTSRYKEFSAYEVINGVHVHRMMTLRRFSSRCSIPEMLVYIFLSLFWLPIKLKKLKPDFVIACFAIPSGPAVYWASLFLNIPYCVALLGSDVPGTCPGQLGIYHRLSAPIQHLIWGHAKFLTANSFSLKELALQFKSNVTVHVVPNGVDQMFFDLEKKPREIESLKKLKILFVGRFSGEKLIYRQIDFMARLHEKQHDEIELHMVGDGPLHSEIKERAKNLGLVNHTVFFYGWKTREELVALYRMADVLCMTSDYEGMPNVILEAMASGCAVVATDATGIRDIVHEGENGFLVSNKELPQFDQIFLRLLADHELLQKLQSQAVLFAKKYSWEDAASQYIGHITPWTKNS